MFQAAGVDGSAGEITVNLSDYVAFGTIADDTRAAALLVSQTGGSGTFYDLAVVQIEDGQAVAVDTIYVGDRVQVNELSIQDGVIVLDMVTQGPEDPMCCPTQRVIQTYELVDGELVLVSSEVVN